MIISGSEKVEDIQRCLNSVNKYVDGIFITITTKTKNNELEVACERYGANVDYQPDKFFKTVDKDTITWLTKFLGEKPSLMRGDRIFDFSMARNHNMNLVPKDFDWILWMDTDDIFRGGKNLRQMVETADQQQIESIFLNYIYQAELEDGKIKHILIEHLRERLIKNTGIYEWIAPIHETLIEKRPTKKIDFKDSDILKIVDSVAWHLIQRSNSSE